MSHAMEVPDARSNLRLANCAGLCHHNIANMALPYRLTFKRCHAAAMDGAKGPSLNNRVDLPVGIRLVGSVSATQDPPILDRLFRLWP